VTTTLKLVKDKLAISALDSLPVSIPGASVSEWIEPNKLLFKIVFGRNLKMKSEINWLMYHLLSKQQVKKMIQTLT